MQPTVFVIAAFPLFLLITGLFWFRAYTGLSRGPAFLALLASVLVGALCTIVPLVDSRGRFHRLHEGGNQMLIESCAATAAIVFLSALAFRLWGRWVGEKATAEERQPGLPGVRAWFSAGNVAVGLILVLTLWGGFDLPPFLIAVVIGAALAAAPLLRTEALLPASAPIPDNHSAEREKILAMLEAGKLTPDESAELLQALRETSPPPARQVPLTGGQRLMLIGAAMVGLGFFLPWLVVNPGKEAGRMMNKMQSSMNSSFNGTRSFPGGMDFPNTSIKTSSVSISGGDIPRGLGWAALLLALTAAFLPYVATTLDAATARTVRLLSLGLGSFILLYLLTQHLRFVSLGLILAAGGYAVEIAGVLREKRAAAVS